MRSKHFFTSIFPAAVLAAVTLLGGCAGKLETYRKQGIALYQKQQYDQSADAFRKALSYDQFDAQANTYAGLIDYRSGNYVEAQYHLALALQSDPSSEEAKNGLTATLIKVDKPDLALDYLERSAALAEKVKDPRWMKSDIRGKYSKQTEERLFVGKVGDRVRIGKTYEELGDYDNAMVYYKKALEMSPENPRVLMTMAALAEKAGNKTAAREYLKHVYLKDPSTPGVTEAMTRNGLAISDVLGAPNAKAPVVPTAK